MRSNYYKSDHLMRLKREFSLRIDFLRSALEGPDTIIRGCQCERLDPVALRLALDDFKVILKEIGRLAR